MKPAQIRVLGIGVLMITTCCQPKENLSVVKQELTIFQSEWLESGNAIRQTLDSLKKDNQMLHDLQVKMKKVKDSGTRLPAKSKIEFDSLYQSVNKLKDSVLIELKDFNHLTQNWNQQKANLNQLVTAVESNNITVTEALEKLSDLRSIRTSAMNELNEIKRERDTYATSLKTCSAKFEKDFPKNIPRV
jgi:hypothetical protein